MAAILLVVGRPAGWITEELGASFEVATVVDPAKTPERIVAVASEVRAIAAFGGGGVVDAALIQRLPALGAVCTFGVGYDRVDLEAAFARGIRVANAPGTTAACVADHAMALLLALERRILAADRHVRGGGWLEARFPLTRRVTGRRMGLFGFGRIGQAIAKRAAGFDMEIAYHNRRALAEMPYRRFDALPDLAAWSDILVVACPATPETTNSVDAGVIAALGTDGVLVNIARGSIVDEEALATALKEGRLAGAALDVFNAEPCRPGALTGLDNVVLTPHCAGSTLETWQDTAALLKANLERFFETGEVLTPVPESRPMTREGSA